ncbi:hypothetical protein HA466_0197310 [Hirschfeldia incana]|nr:hypothetical protein HA466_0197310 [Hirschfeldia incana]
MAKIFSNTLYLSALMMFILFVSSGLPKVNGQDCTYFVGEGIDEVCFGGSGDGPCDATCKITFSCTTIFGKCESKDGALHCRCYIPC